MFPSRGVQAGACAVGLAAGLQLALCTRPPLLEPPVRNRPPCCAAPAAPLHAACAPCCALPGPAPTPATPHGPPPRSRLRSGDRAARQRVPPEEAAKWAAGRHDARDAPGGLSDAVPLPPQLAGLAWLEDLELVQHMAPWAGGLPPEWLAPGALPRLRRCAGGGGWGLGAGGWGWLAAVRERVAAAAACATALRSAHVPRPSRTLPPRHACLAPPRPPPGTRRLALGGSSLGSPLPDLQPGQLPELRVSGVFAAVPLATLSP